MTTVRRYRIHLWAAAVVLAAAGVGALLVPRYRRGHGDTLTGGSVPIWENNTELRLAILTVGVVIAVVLLIVSRRSSSS
jgi:heme/copper-type cytochrome/quinol oxidase subunit 2